MMEKRTEVECISRGELACVFGDCTNHGAGKSQYSGIWSLTSLHQIHSAFVSSYAGAVFSHHRYENPHEPCPVRLYRTGEYKVEFRRNNTTLETRCSYELREPYYIDCLVTIRPLQDPGVHPLRFSWCCYINSPEDPDIHFISEEGSWFRAHSPRHGQDATYCPISVEPLAEKEKFAPEEGFWTGYATERFKLPFYYGRIRNMAFIVMFDRADDIRFLISPSGGGISILPGKTNPAWDWMWFLEDYEVEQESQLHFRIAYRVYTSPSEILAEYEKFAESLHSTG